MHPSLDPQFQIPRLLAKPEFLAAIENLPPSDQFEAQTVARRFGVAASTLREAVRVHDNRRGVTRLALVEPGLYGATTVGYMTATRAPAALEPRGVQDQHLIDISVQLGQHLRAAALSYEAATRLGLAAEGRQLLDLGHDIVRAGAVVSALPQRVFPRKQSRLLRSALGGEALTSDTPKAVQHFLDRMAVDAPTNQARGSLFGAPEPKDQFLKTAMQTLWPADRYGPHENEVLLRSLGDLARASASITTQLRGAATTPPPAYTADMQRFILSRVELSMTGRQASMFLSGRSGDPADALRLHVDLPAVGTHALRLEFAVSAQRLLRTVASESLMRVGGGLAGSGEWSAIPSTSAEAMRAFGGALWTSLMRADGDPAGFERGAGSVKAGTNTYSLVAAAGLPLVLHGPVAERTFPARAATTFLRTVFATPELATTASRDASGGLQQ